MISRTAFPLLRVLSRCTPLKSGSLVKRIDELAESISDFPWEERSAKEAFIEKALDTSLDKIAEVIKKEKSEDTALSCPLCGSHVKRNVYDFFCDSCGFTMKRVIKDRFI